MVPCSRDELELHVLLLVEEEVARNHELFFLVLVNWVRVGQYALLFVETVLEALLLLQQLGHTRVQGEYLAKGSILELTPVKLICWL